MEIKAWECSSGKRCAFVAVAGKPGLGGWPMCVDCV